MSSPTSASALQCVSIQSLTCKKKGFLTVRKGNQLYDQQLNSCVDIDHIIRVGNLTIPRGRRFSKFPRASVYTASKTHISVILRDGKEEEEEDLLLAWSQDGTPGPESIPTRQASNRRSGRRIGLRGASWRRGRCNRSLRLLVAMRRRSLAWWGS